MFTLFVTLLCCVLAMGLTKHSIGIRRDILQLSIHEKENMLQALYKMKSTPSRYNRSYSSYDYYTFLYNTHVIQRRNAMNFLLWHRLFIYYFEKELQHFMNDSSFRLPYCELTNPLSIFTTIFDESFLGGNGIQNNNWILSNFSHLSCNKWPIDQRLTKGTRFEKYTCLSRQIGENQIFPHLPAQNEWLETLDTKYDIYSSDFIALHDAVDGYIGGHQLSPSSTVDPIFFLLYNWMDALWSLYQDKNGLYYKFPVENLNMSYFDGHFNDSRMNTMDIIDVRNSLNYVYQIQLHQQGLSHHILIKWWQSDIIKAFAISVIIFIFVIVLFICLRKLHYKAQTSRSMSSDSLSLLLM